MSLPNATNMAAGIQFATDAWNSFPLLLTLLGLLAAFVLGRAVLNFFARILRRVR